MFLFQTSAGGKQQNNGQLQQGMPNSSFLLNQTTVKITRDSRKSEEVEVQLPAIKIAVRKGSETSESSGSGFFSMPSPSKGDLVKPGSQNAKPAKKENQEIRLDHNLNDFVIKTQFESAKFMAEGDYYAAGQLLSQASTSLRTFLDSDSSQAAFASCPLEMKSIMQKEADAACHKLDLLGKTCELMQSTYIFLPKNRRETSAYAEFQALPKEELAKLLGEPAYNMILNHLASFEYAQGADIPGYSSQISSESTKADFLLVEKKLSELKEFISGCQENWKGESHIKSSIHSNKRMVLTLYTLQKKAESWGLSEESSRLYIVNSLTTMFVNALENYRAAALLDMGARGKLEGILSSNPDFAALPAGLQGGLAGSAHDLYEKMRGGFAKEQADARRLANKAEEGYMRRNIAPLDDASKPGSAEPLFNEKNISSFALAKSLSDLLPGCHETGANGSLLLGALKVRNLASVAQFEETFSKTPFDARETLSGLSKKAQKTALGEEVITVGSIQALLRNFEDELSGAYGLAYRRLESKQYWEILKKGGKENIFDASAGYTQLYGKQALMYLPFAASLLFTKNAKAAQVVSEVSMLALGSWDIYDRNYMGAATLLLGMYGGRKIPFMKQPLPFGESLQKIATAKMMYDGAVGAVDAIDNMSNYGISATGAFDFSSSIVMGLLLPAYHGNIGAKAREQARIANSVPKTQPGIIIENTLQAFKAWPENQRAIRSNLAKINEALGEEGVSAASKLILRERFNQEDSGKSACDLSYALQGISRQGMEAFAECSKLADAYPENPQIAKVIISSIARYSSSAVKTAQFFSESGVASQISALVAGQGKTREILGTLFNVHRFEGKETAMEAISTLSKYKSAPEALDELCLQLDEHRHSQFRRKDILANADASSQVIMDYSKLSPQLGAELAKCLFSEKYANWREGLLVSIKNAQNMLLDPKFSTYAKKFAARPDFLAMIAEDGRLPAPEFAELVPKKGKYRKEIASKLADIASNLGPSSAHYLKVLQAFSSDNAVLLGVSSAIAMKTGPTLANVFFERAEQISAILVSPQARKAIGACRGNETKAESVARALMNEGMQAKLDDAPAPTTIEKISLKLYKSPPSSIVEKSAKNAAALDAGRAIEAAVREYYPDWMAGESSVLSRTLSGLPASEALVAAKVVLIPEIKEALNSEMDARILEFAGKYGENATKELCRLRLADGYAADDLLKAIGKKEKSQNNASKEDVISTIHALEAYPKGSDAREQAHFTILMKLNNYSVVSKSMEMLASPEVVSLFERSCRLSRPVPIEYGKESNPLLYYSMLTAQQMSPKAAKTINGMADAYEKAAAKARQPPDTYSLLKNLFSEFSSKNMDAEEISEICGMLSSKEGAAWLVKVGPDQAASLSRIAAHGKEIFDSCMETLSTKPLKMAQAGNSVIFAWNALEAPKVLESAKNLRGKKAQALLLKTVKWNPAGGLANLAARGEAVFGECLTTLLKTDANGESLASRGGAGVVGAWNSLGTVAIMESAIRLRNKRAAKLIANNPEISGSLAKIAANGKGVLLRCMTTLERENLSTNFIQKNLAEEWAAMPGNLASESAVNLRDPRVNMRDPRTANADFISSLAKLAKYGKPAFSECLATLCDPSFSNAQSEISRGWLLLDNAKKIQTSASVLRSSGIVSAMTLESHLGSEAAQACAYGERAAKLAMEIAGKAEKADVSSTIGSANRSFAVLDSKGGIAGRGMDLLESLAAGLPKEKLKEGIGYAEKLLAQAKTQFEAEAAVEIAGIQANATITAQSPQAAEMLPALLASKNGLFTAYAAVKLNDNAALESALNTTDGHNLQYFNKIGATRKLMENFAPDPEVRKAIKGAMDNGANMNMLRKAFPDVKKIDEYYVLYSLLRNPKCFADRNDADLTKYVSGVEGKILDPIANGKLKPLQARDFAVSISKPPFRLEQARLDELSSIDLDAKAEGYSPISAIDAIKSQGGPMVSAGFEYAGDAAAFALNGKKYTEFSEFAEAVRAFSGKPSKAVEGNLKGIGKELERMGKLKNEDKTLEAAKKADTAEKIGKQVEGLARQMERDMNSGEQGSVKISEEESGQLLRHFLLERLSFREGCMADAFKNPGDGGVRIIEAAESADIAIGEVFKLEGAPDAAIRIRKLFNEYLRNLPDTPESKMWQSIISIPSEKKGYELEFAEQRARVQKDYKIEIRPKTFVDETGVHKCGSCLGEDLSQSTGLSQERVVLARISDEKGELVGSVVVMLDEGTKSPTGESRKTMTIIDLEPSAEVGIRHGKDINQLVYFTTESVREFASQNGYELFAHSLSNMHGRFSNKVSVCNAFDALYGPFDGKVEGGTWKYGKQLYIRTYGYSEAVPLPSAKGPPTLPAPKSKAPPD